MNSLEHRDICHAPIGVFDSGVGGLTVAREIMRNLPSEKIVYFGDTARVPYGSKSKDALVSILSASENTYKSITAVFGQKMNIFDDINVANVTCTSDFKFNVLGSEPVALYVIVPDEDKTYFTLVTIIVGLLYRDLVKLANSNDKKKLPYEIDFILDERR